MTFRCDDTALHTFGIPAYEDITQSLQAHLEYGLIGDFADMCGLGV